MKLFKIFGLWATLSLCGISLYGQDLPAEGLNSLQTYRELPDSRERLNYFLKEADRYASQSPYDWLDQVNVDLNTAAQKQDTTALRIYRYIQASLYYDLGDYNKSVSIANDLFLEVDKKDTTSLQIVLDLIDQNYGQLKFSDKQIEIRKKKRDLGLVENISFYDIYADLGLYRKALRSYITEQKKNVDNSDLFQLANYNNTIGEFMLKDNTAAAALTYFKKAQGYLSVYSNDINEVRTEREKAEADLLEARIDGNIGRSHVKLTQYREALPFLETSIAYLEDMKEEHVHRDLDENILALAKAHLELDNLEKAVEYLGVQHLTDDADLRMKRNLLLSSYYHMVGDFENEVDRLRQNVRIQDSLDRSSLELNKQQLIAVTAEGELEDSRLVNDALKKEVEIGRAELQAQDMRINLVFISLVFTLLGLVGMVYAYMKSIKNQRLIAEQKQIISDALVEKDSLLKEIHHRVKNNLQMVSSLLSLQTKNTRSRAAIEALEEGKTRVKAMALIHQKLYQNDDLSVIEMQGYIESLINSVQSVFKKGGHRITITIDAEDVELDIDRAIPFGLILNELVSNSFKYAFPDPEQEGQIYIHIRKNGEGGFFEYTDNGVGLSEDSEERANNSMGIRLIKRLVNQLQSTLNTDKTAQGVRFWFNFK
ncbi:Two-component sensor histidine kinase, contains HisKA and HATPase domains [Robiginitalea myxolifaciens]|uniref:histidine kinase n=1 Tax=Robiginitalea myxolifaciens TaxID=400055 RepID=A0A1I6GTV2_9FLAO|nr:sensor histidine kinase [Robiginitalea myxolifaciens]SFR45665.1 Two-component sensor histidine kinase, contains HisKA and HATPase domains [Robiginitalea myxolifaciens]